MYLKFHILCVFLLNIFIVNSQYADESVKEDFDFIPSLNGDKNKINYINELFNKIKSDEVISAHSPTGYSSYTKDDGPAICMHQRSALNNNRELSNISFYTKIALKLGNQIAENNKTLFSTFQTFQLPQEECPFTKAISCNPKDIYRTADGSCNNLKFPQRGMANLPFKRVLRPRYDNDIDKFRSKSVTGFRLPNPRSISLALSNDNQAYDLARTSINAAFGQFIDHDFTDTLATSEIRCDCDSTNPECINIQTPIEDKLNLNDQKCMTVIRSVPVFTNINCGFGYREQLNKLTAPIDLSQVYGYSVDQQTDLRLKKMGLLRFTARSNNQKEYLPSDALGGCRDETVDKPCFKSGDERTNINLNLAGMHTIWLREHNRLARNLLFLNRNWTDEKVYQEARRINIAMMQNIIYTEWLPVIIGWNAMEKYDLLSSAPSYYTRYSENVDSGVFNEFSTAAFRLHTLVRSAFTQINENFPSRNLTLQEVTFRPSSAYEFNGLDGLLKGALVDPIGKFDPSFTSDLGNRLFEVPGDTSSTTKRFDLAALNINRCRDHGCATYVEFREWCGLGVARQFSDLFEIEPKNQQRLGTIYADVRDIDLFAGGISEKPIPGAVVGPTFACMIGRQFRDFKRGDRFFYENDGFFNPNPFNSNQLAEIRKVTLSKILCENLDSISSIQPNAFISSAVPNNVKIPCTNIPPLNLALWAEKN